uniref:Uncharacterized protein n=1 Tax=Aegilops tauschii subsp. strangulata TaxID=200361 RepID=A0A453HTL2_AEGTS
MSNASSAGHGNVSCAQRPDGRLVNSRKRQQWPAARTEPSSLAAATCMSSRFRRRTTPEAKQSGTGDGGTRTWTHGFVPSATGKRQTTAATADGACDCQALANERGEAFLEATAL